jgi:hypothetical protein
MELAPTLMDIFLEIPDRRASQGKRYPLPGVLALVCLAVRSGCGGIRAIARWGEMHGWRLATRLGFKPGRMPSERSLRRILAQVEVGTVEQSVSRWVEAVTARLGPPVIGVAIDGKRLRGSGGDEEGQVRQVRNALGQPLGVVLRQQAIAEGSSELGTMTALLEALSWKAGS